MESRSNKITASIAWCTFAVVAIVVVGGINLVHALRRVPPAPHYAPVVPTNNVVRHEQRFAGMRAALKTHHVRGTIGYLADLPPERMRENAAAMEELFLTQFALVPVVFETKVETCTWAVTNFHTASPAERLPPGFRVVEDFGGGVLLLRKEIP
jgi:hypothetical protein